VFSFLNKSKDDIKQALKSGAMVIDVRTREEFNSGSFPGSVNIPHDIIGTEIQKLNIPKDRTIVVYCKMGGRAGTAKQVLEGMGYKVLNAGGFSDISKLV
jgi:rhodanese-related sulfurtransferase